MNKYLKNETKAKKLYEKLVKREFKDCFVKIKIDKNGLIIECKKEVHETL